jgi:hypothetical protein
MPAKLSADWFPPKERVISTMIGVNAAILGCVLGFYAPLVFVTADRVSDGDEEIIE